MGSQITAMSAAFFELQAGGLISIFFVFVFCLAYFAEEKQMSQ